MFAIILGVLFAILGYVAIIALSGLLYWGVGAFVIWAFGIGFTWTYVHGVAVAIIVSVLCSVFKKIFGKD